MKKKTNAGNTSMPAPAKLSRDNKMWTASENKMLDQITTEIIEAWAKDLEIIRSNYSEAVKLNQIIKTFDVRISKIDNQLSSIENPLEDLHEKTDQSLENIYDRLDKFIFTKHKDLCVKIKDLKIQLDHLIKLNTKETEKETEKEKKWWQFWL